MKILLMSVALSLAGPHPQEPIREPAQHRIVENAVVTGNAVTAGPPALLVYPVAGASGTDFTVPFFVDLEEGPGIRDYNCGGQTFEGHAGQDPYIRSFSEQRIGVPVFAVLDGTVIELREDQPDENTDNAPAPANFVTIRHANGVDSQYVHLRRDSVPVNVGDFVTAGTQIGLVGSSGASLAPHIHFELLYKGEVVEPMAGPCRPGYSFFRDQPATNSAFTFIRGTLSRTSFATVPPAPHDEAPPQGMFRRGQQTLFYKADLANVPSSTEYELYLERPNGTRVPIIAASALLSRSAALASVWWQVNVDLDATGTWEIVLEIEGNEEFRRPFTVVSNATPLSNRAPNPISASIAPFTFGEVPVCRVSGDPLADPDYDVVAYRYQWHVGNVLVRDVTSAATTDALARGLVTSRSVTCTVTASDRTLSTQPATAFAEAGVAKRRAVRTR